LLGLIIGDSDTITGFRLVGVEGVEVSSVDEAEQAFDKALQRSDLAMIILSQAFSFQEKMHEKIETVRRERRTPLIVEVPPSHGPKGEGHLADVISKTLGFRL
jgi:vacuolar-type H+-ATPase subunit F/Vma7